MTVDIHFGQVDEFYIYEYRKESAMFLEKRNIEKYCNGAEHCHEENKTGKLISAISDCDGVISLRIGEEPTRKLKENNIKAFMTCERVEDAVVMAAKSILGEIVKEKIRIVE